MMQTYGGNTEMPEAQIPKCKKNYHLEREEGRTYLCVPGGKARGPKAITSGSRVAKPLPEKREGESYQVKMTEGEVYVETA